jgi:uncharacterized protein (UPF0333 family)
MLQYLNQKKGQSTLEYAVLIVVIIGALLTIQVYIKRGIQGRLRQASDDIGDQYSPGNTNVLKTVTRNGSVNEDFGVGAVGVSATVMNGPELTNSASNQVILNSAQEFWGN